MASVKAKAGTALIGPSGFYRNGGCGRSVIVASAGQDCELRALSVSIVYEGWPAVANFFPAVWFRLRFANGFSVFLALKGNIRRANNQ
jgi:hypothetical protein